MDDFEQFEELVNGRYHCISVVTHEERYALEIVRQAAISLDQARNATRQVAQGLLLEDNQAQNTLNAAYENYFNVKDNMELSQKVYDVTLIKYQEGLATSLELTQANDRYLLSQSNYIQALLALLNAKNTLDRIRNAYD